MYAAVRVMSTTMNDAVMKAVFEVLEQNQKLTTMVACDAAKKVLMHDLWTTMVNTVGKTYVHHWQSVRRYPSLIGNLYVENW